MQSSIPRKRKAFPLFVQMTAFGSSYFFLLLYSFLTHLGLCRPFYGFCRFDRLACHVAITTSFRVDKIYTIELECGQGV